jgi:hypothetical protein
VALVIVMARSSSSGAARPTGRDQPKTDKASAARSLVNRWLVESFDLPLWTLIGVQELQKTLKDSKWFKERPSDL